METKKTLSLFLLSFLLLLVTPVLTTIPAATVQASTSEDEDEEDSEEVTEETTDEEATTAAAAPVAPTQQAQQQEQQQQALTTEQLMQKYATNRTLPDFVPFNATAATAPTPTGPKAIVLTFDDNWKSQYTFAEPIVRQNGFNASWFIYCLAGAQGPGFMTDAELNDLHKKGYDIESHSMTHLNLSKATPDQLQFEVAESKACIQDLVPGAKINTFAVPFAAGADNRTILQAIQQAGYEVGRTGYAGSFDLQCQPGYLPNETAGCEMLKPGTSQLKEQNRWNVPVLDVNGIGRDNNFDRQKTQAEFVAAVNDGLAYDDTGKLRALPVLVYHNFSNTVLPPDEMGQSLLVQSFVDQMNYLKANGFTVLSMADLQYNPQTHVFSIPKIDAIESSSATQQQQQQ